VLLLLLSGCAATPRRDGPASSTSTTLTPRIIFLDEGAVTDRGYPLAAIRTLGFGGSTPHCSGTLVREGNGPVGFLTAAHCIYELDGDQHIGRRHDDVVIQGLPPSVVRRVRVGRTFAICAIDHLSFERCIDDGADDVAWIDLDVGELSVATWRPCRDLGPRMPESLLVFGFGVHRAKSLLVGTFTLETPGAAGTWTAVGNAARVAYGDSGGPALSALDHGDGPRVCFTVSAMRLRLLEDPGGTTGKALLQPAWSLDARLEPAIP
jgi:hypothetical protein